MSTLGLSVRIMGTQIVASCLGFGLGLFVV